MPFLEAIFLKGLIAGVKILGPQAFIVLKAMFAGLGFIGAVKATVAVGTVIGGITWTRERIKLMEEMISGIKNNDPKKAVKAFATLSNSTNIDSLTDATYQYLLEAGNNTETANRIVKGVREIATVVKDEARKSGRSSSSNKEISTFRSKSSESQPRKVNKCYECGKSALGLTDCCRKPICKKCIEEEFFINKKGNIRFDCPICPEETRVNSTKFINRKSFYKENHLECEECSNVAIGEPADCCNCSLCENCFCNGLRVTKKGRVKFKCPSCGDTTDVDHFLTTLDSIRELQEAFGTRKYDV